MNMFVSVDWLKARLFQQDVRIIDCRFNLAKPQEGMNDYVDGHIPGALYFDLNNDLSSEVQQHGGRHPLPSMKDWQDKLETAGISKRTRVVLYDATGGAYAARCWWLFRYVGHEDVFILSGGFAAWQREKFPVTNEVKTYERTAYRLELQPQLLADVDDVRAGGATLIDSREVARYRGDIEPIDAKKGHIPTARSFFWQDVYEADGTLKSNEQLASRFSSLDKAEPIIVYCGSGVTACPNVLALTLLGYRDVRLYAGSFSDWISYDDNEVATVQGDAQ